MPNAVIKSFANKSGKSVAEVEKIYQEIKSSAKNPEDYAYVIGTLKKILKLNEGINMNLLNTFTDLINLLKEETSTADIASVESAPVKPQKRPKNSEGREEEEEIQDSEEENDSKSREDIEKKVLKTFKK